MTILSVYACGSQYTLKSIESSESTQLDREQIKSMIDFTSVDSVEGLDSAEN